MNLESLPDLPLHTILKYLDGVSVYNLSNVSTKLDEKVHENLDEATLIKCFVNGWDQWKSDPVLLSAVASFDGNVERHRPRSNGGENLFQWDTAFNAAYGLSRILRYGVPKFVNLEAVSAEIKEDIAVQYPENEQRYSYPDRLSSSSGSLVFNAMRSGNGKSDLLVYEDFEHCRRVVSLPQEAAQCGQVVILGRDEMTPSVGSVRVPLLGRFLITLDDKTVYASGLQEGPAVELHTAYKNAAEDYRYLPPQFSVLGNHVAVWGCPFSVEVFSLSVGVTGAPHVNSRQIFQLPEESYIRVSEPYKGYKRAGYTSLLSTDLWEKMIELKSPFIFSLESSEFHATKRAASFQAFVIFPMEKVYVLELVEGTAVVIEKPVQHFPYEVDDHFLKEGTEMTSGHNLKVMWTSSVLALSPDSFKWYFSYWKTLNVCNAFKLPLIHVVAPNMLAVLRDDQLTIACVNLREDLQEDGDQLMLPWVQFEVIRLLDLGLSQLGLEARQFRFDYDHGTPYFWFEVDHVAARERTGNGKKWQSTPYSFEFYKLSFE